MSYVFVKLSGAAVRHYHAHTGTWFFQVACRMTHDRTAGAYGSIRAKTRRENTRRKRGTSEVADLTILQFPRAFAALCPADSPRRTAWPLPSHRLLQTECPILNGHTAALYQSAFQLRTGIRYATFPRGAAVVSKEGYPVSHGRPVSAPVIAATPQ